jgi:hypothetical protein
VKTVGAKEFAEYPLESNPRIALQVSGCDFRANRLDS